MIESKEFIILILNLILILILIEFLNCEYSLNKNIKIFDKSVFPTCINTSI